MAYTQKINSRDKDTPGTFRKDQGARYKKVNTKEGVSEFVNIDNPKQKRYGVPGPGGVMKTLKNKKGETYKG